jgi:hypothetical protein
VDMDTLLTRDLSLTRARVCDEVGLLRYATNHHHLFVQTEQKADDGSADKNFQPLNGTLMHFHQLYLPLRGFPPDDNLYSSTLEGCAVRTLGSVRASSVGKGEGRGSQAVEPNSYDSQTAGNNEWDNNTIESH